MTASQRLAREVLLQHADSLSATQGAWERPPVWSWSGWMRELWVNSAWFFEQARSARVIDSGRKRIIWEQLISESGVGGGLMQLHSVAKAAVEAWDLVCTWRVTMAEVAGMATEDAARFAEWARAYETLCANNGWIDEARLPLELAERMSEGKISLAPASLILAGFDELTPAQQYFIERIETAGTTVQTWLPSNKNTAITVCGAADSEAELTAAARWSLECLMENPAATIGIVVPDLAASHTKVDRIFTEILAPGAVEEIAGEGGKPFSLSAGASLISQPLIGTAIELLALAGDSPPWSTVSQLLRSQFLGDAVAEANARAAFDAKYRAYSGIRWPLDSLVTALEKEQDKHDGCSCPALSKRGSAALALSRGWPDRQTTREWVMDISAWLDALGWPGERVLNSSEYQAQQRWREVLEDLASYDELLGKITFSNVVGQLRSVAGSSTFKPESDRSPILVLGALEAAGLEFDHIWVSGLHDGAWPPAPAPTPFLPYSLQRSLMLPRGSSGREVKFARLVLERMTESANDVRLSWPAADGDEVLRPSPLLERFVQGDDIPVSNLAGEGRSGAIYRLRPKLALIEDGIAPKCSNGYAAPGGARVLELQSLCPFRAFAELRLGVGPLEQPSAGLNPRQRGQLAHDALYFLWRAWEGRESLVAADAAKRRMQIVASVEKAAERITTQGNPVLHQTLLLEKSRLASLLEELLLLELQRPDFKILLVEKRREISIAGLSLAVRPDRIDVVDESARLVIDYKTGEVKTTKWLGDRPREPQLLLYATCLDIENVRGVSFLQLRGGALKFAGLCASEEGMPNGVKRPGKAVLASQGVKNWDELLAGWRQTLHGLAAGFCSGDARVDPLKSACDYCHLRAACRIEEKKSSGEVSMNV